MGMIENVAAMGAAASPPLAPGEVRFLKGEPRSSGQSRAAGDRAPPFENRALSLNPSAGTMRLDCPGTSTSIVPLSGRGPDGQAIEFNISYLRDFCPPGEAIRLCATGSSDPAILRGADPNVLMILMPMRV